MNYKAIFLDMDGTLLNSKKEISDYTCSVLNIISKKVPIIIASARGFKTIEPYIKKLNIQSENNYTIAFNGSLILSNDESTIIENKKLNQEDKNAIKKYIIDNRDLDWTFYTYNDRVNVRNINDFEKILDQNDIYKIVCISTEEKIMYLRDKMDSMLKQRFEITSSELNRIEFVKSGMTKIKAIMKILDRLEIEKDEAIAIGDGENDIGMIEFVGLGIAMGNAPELVKNSADLITDTNDKDGVAKVLKKIFKVNL